MPELDGGRAQKPLRACHSLLEGEPRRELGRQDWLERATRFQTNNPGINDVVAQAIHDLAGLRMHRYDKDAEGGTGEGSRWVPVAGCRSTVHARAKGLLQPRLQGLWGRDRHRGRATGQAPRRPLRTPGLRRRCQARLWAQALEAGYRGRPAAVTGQHAHSRPDGRFPASPRSARNLSAWPAPPAPHSPTPAGDAIDARERQERGDQGGVRSSRRLAPSKSPCYSDVFMEAQGDSGIRDTGLLNR
jgi:hypothetical protein